MSESDSAVGGKMAPTMFYKISGKIDPVTFTYLWCKIVNSQIWVIENHKKF